MIDSGMGAREIAEAEGRSISSVQNKMYKSGLKTNSQVSDINVRREGTQFTDSGKSATLVTVDRKIKTADDAVEYAKVDTRIWEIERFLVNKWEQGSANEGDVSVVELWQVKVWLRRKVKQLDQKSFEFLKDVISSCKWKPAKRPDKRVEGEHMLEVSLFDAHFGKLCWEQETGTDYDTAIADRYFLNAVDDLLADNGDLSLEKILFPVGQDFFNVDNLRRETTSGTPQDVDDRYHRVFAKGFAAVVAAIERCRKMAPVEIVFIEGNHDTLAGWHLAFSIAQLYKDAKDITVDYGPQSRKYRKYGKTLLGFTHGDGEKPSDRTTLMAREASEHWHGCDFYEWHTGHFHAEKKLQQAGTETNGIVERVLPSLSGTDRWHAKKGFSLNRQAAMAFAYHKENGMRRTSYAYARNR
jgi:hypothetical protein